MAVEGINMGIGFETELAEKGSGAHVDGLETVGVAAIDGLEESCIVGPTEGSWVEVNDNESACIEIGTCGFDAIHRGFDILFSSARSISRHSPTAAAVSAMYFLYISISRVLQREELQICHT